MTDAQLPQILVVDDRQENLFAMQKLLKPLEIEVFVADSGDEALGLALEHEFFAAILDVQMAGMDGYELAEFLRGHNATSTLPIIFVSAAFSDEYHHRKAYEAGAVDFISKPFVPEILLSKIKVFLDLYEQRRTLQTTVSELNKANTQLALVNRELDTFSYSISHDLRAPLRAVTGFSHMLSDSLGNDISPEARRYLETIQANVHQMDDLINGLLQFSRLAFEPLSNRTVNMHELVEHVLTDLGSNQPNDHAKIQLDQNLPPAWGDPFLIRQAITNLLHNAFKYSRKTDQPLIEIGFRQNGNQVIYFIRDNGVGFNMEYADKLFGVFQRLHSADEFEGIGVGLANVRRIIIRHGGAIWAEAAPGQGATFYFTLQPA